LLKTAAFFFFLGMMCLSALAETAGLFDWLAIQAAAGLAAFARRGDPAD